MAWVEFRKGKLIDSDKFSYIGVIEETVTVDDTEDDGEYCIRFVCDGRNYSTESYGSREKCEIAFRYLRYALKLGVPNIDMTSVPQLVDETSVPQDRIPMTEEYLLSKGFQKEIDEELGLEGFVTPDERIIVGSQHPYKILPYDWNVIVKNWDMNDIGSLDFAYVDQFEAFLKLCGVDYGEK